MSLSTWGLLFAVFALIEAIRDQPVAMAISLVAVAVVTVGSHLEDKL